MASGQRPGWESENELAVSLGWKPVLDLARDCNPGTNWCRFEKDDEVVWLCRNLHWARATVDPQTMVHSNHMYYVELNDALTGANGQVNNW